MAVDNAGLQAYEAPSADWVEPEDRPEGTIVLGQCGIESVVAEGGPYDGLQLTVPPGGMQVLLPAAYANPQMAGKVIYERRDGKMVYVGQPDQTDAAHTDEDEDGGLILP